jgi:ABC-type transporter Mla maintaining outer membrane lipid asymmetry ATPase subunit MlaF
MVPDIWLSCRGLERFLGEEDSRVDALRGVSLDLEPGSVHAEDFTAQENVMIPMRRLGRLTENEMRDRAAELLNAVDLGNKLSRPSRHLSGGEQQRFAVARALANDPRVILADKPTGNLDSANSQRAFELLQDIVKEGGKALHPQSCDRRALRLGPRNTGWRYYRQLSAEQCREMKFFPGDSDS